MFLKFGGITRKVRKINTVICQKQNKVVNNMEISRSFNCNQRKKEIDRF
jgi:hypothetical protein